MPTPVQQDPLQRKTGFAPPGSAGWTPAPNPPPPTAASGGVSTPPTNVALNDPKPGSVSAHGTVTPGGPTPVQQPTAAPDSGLLSTPGAYEEWLKTHMGALGTPTRTEGLYDSGGAAGLDNSPLSGVHTADSSADYNAWLAANGGVTGGGDSAGVLSGLASGPSKASQVYMDTAKGALGGPGATETTYAKSGNAFDSTGAAEDWYAKYGNDPMQKSYTESLYEGGIGQLDPYYQRQQDLAIRDAQTASAARGGFNSGYAGQQERDLIGNFKGQQAKEWVDLAPQADAAKLARYNQGEKFAGDAGDAYSKRINDMFGLATATDKATNDRVSTLSGAAAAGDSADNAAANTRVSAANNADRNAVDIYTANEGAHATGANLTREQADQNIGLATAQDTANRNNINAKFGLAGAADSSDLGRLFAQGGMAKDLQSTGQDRITGGLSATTDQATREAKLVQDIQGDTANIDSMDDTALQALADKYGVSLQELNSVKDDAKSLVALLTSAASGKK